jgi:hypothetical protein
MARKSLTLVSVGPVITWSPSASKKPWPSLSARLSAGADAHLPGARQRVGSDDRAGHFFGTVDAIGVAGDRPHVRQAIERHGERQQKLDVAAAAAAAAHVTVVSPPDSSTHGGRSGWPCCATVRAMPAITLPTSRASPSMASPRSSGVTPASRATSAAASSAICGVAIRRISARASRGVAGLDALAAAACQHIAHARRQVDAVAAHERQRVGAGGGIGDGGTGGDVDRVVTRHVGERQRQHAGRVAGGGKPPALDGRQVPAHAVHLVDAGAGRSSSRFSCLLVFEREAGRSAAAAAPSRRRRSGTARDRRQ